MSEINQEAILALLKEFEEMDHDKFIEYFMKSQTPAKDLKGISDDDMETVYEHAFNAFNYNKFEDAKVIFTTLTQLDHTSQRYWVGLGASHQMLNEYNEALYSYSMAVRINPDDNKPVFYSAECQLALGDKDAAINSLNIAIEELKKTGNDPEILSKSESLLEHIKHNK